MSTAPTKLFRADMRTVGVESDVAKIETDIIGCGRLLTTVQDPLSRRLVLPGSEFQTNGSIDVRRQSTLHPLRVVVTG